MRYAPRAILAGGLGFAVSCVAACGGGSGLLSGDQSIALSGQGNEINSAVQSGNCGAAINASAALNHDVQNLPVTVNPTLRSNLSQGALTIAQLAAKDCRQHDRDDDVDPHHDVLDDHHRRRRPRPRRTDHVEHLDHARPRPRPRRPPTTATTPTDTGTSSTTTTSGGAGLGGASTTTTGTGNSGGTGAGNGNGGGNGGGG